MRNKNNALSFPQERKGVFLYSQYRVQGTGPLPGIKGAAPLCGDFQGAAPLGPPQNFSCPTESDRLRGGHGVE